MPAGSAQMYKNLQWIGNPVQAIGRAISLSGLKHRPSAADRGRDRHIRDLVVIRDRREIPAEVHWIRHLASFQ